MPHEASVTTYLPEGLIVAMEEVAKDKDWTLAEAHERALQAFIAQWNAGKTSRRYYGHPPDSRQKSVWMSAKVRDSLRQIRKQDGVRLSMVIQEAFRLFSSQEGRPVPVPFPAQPVEL